MLDGLRSAGGSGAAASRPTHGPRMLRDSLWLSVPPPEPGGAVPCYCKRLLHPARAEAINLSYGRLGGSTDVIRAIL